MKYSDGSCLHDQKGVALVVVLLALVLLTTLVVEFSYGVYTGTNDLYNWRDSQRLSVMARSGINVTARTLSGLLSTMAYKFTDPVEQSIENPFEDFKGGVAVRIEDEMGKFNLNSLVPPNQKIREDDPASPYNCFKRLLTLLSMDVKIADRVVDWIDRDSEARISGSESDAKNAPFDSVDELLLVHGITKEDYDKLVSYLTVYGSGKININTAPKLVLRSLSKDMTDELAQRIIDYRRGTPFRGTDSLNSVNGITMELYGSVSGLITSESSTFSIRSAASSEGVKRVIEAVLETSSNTVLYWKEY